MIETIRETGKKAKEEYRLSPFFLMSSQKLIFRVYLLYIRPITLKINVSAYVEIKNGLDEHCRPPSPCVACARGEQ